MQYAGRVAAEGVSSLYREFVGDGSENRPTHSYGREDRRDETVVLRGEASPGAASRPNARMRRPVQGTSSGPGGKKDS